MNTSKRKLIDHNNLFQKKEKKIQFLLLDYIFQSDLPIGTWNLQSLLEDNDIKISTATVGRYLKKLDQKGYTQQYKNQGRILTNKGKDYVETVKEELKHNCLRGSLLKAAKPKNIKELIKVFEARYGLESIATKKAAENANSKDIKKLEKALEAHRKIVYEGIEPRDSALDFHRVISSMSKNQFISAALDLLIYEENQMEKNIGYVVTSEKGVKYYEQHKKIVEMIKQKSPKKAEIEMQKHLTSIIEDLKKQACKK